MAPPTPPSPNPGEPPGPPGPTPPERRPGGRILVVAAVIRRAGRVLLAQRSPRSRHGGLWEFPGGKLTPGETEREALARELDEELAVTLVEVGACLYTALDPGSPYRIRFWESSVTGEPRALEHSQIAWVTPTEAGGLPLAPTDARFLADWLRRRKGGPGR